MTLSVNSTTKGFTDNDGYFITEYNAAYKITSITPNANFSSQPNATQNGNVYAYTKDGDNYTYNVSANGVVTSYSIKKIDASGSNTLNYNSSGILQTSVKQEGVRTTTTSYNSNAEPTKTTTGFNFTGLTGYPNPPGHDSIGNYYSDGGTNYYVDGSNNILKYSTTYTGSNTYDDWQTHHIKSDYTSTTTYDATGKVISSGGTNISTDTNATNTQTDIDLAKSGVQTDSSSYTTIEKFDANNNVIGHTQKSDWTNQWGTGKSETDYDANWQVTKSTNGGTNTWTETWNNNRVITNTYSNTVTYDAAGKVIDNSGLNKSVDSTGKVTYSSTWTTADVSVTNNNVTTVIHVQKNTWQDENGNLGSSDYSYDANWQMLKGTGTNTYTETWNNNQKITNTYSNESLWNADHTKIIGNKGSNESKDSSGTVRDSSTYQTIDKFDSITGNLTGHSNSSSWSNSWGTGSSTSEYDTSWQNISYTSTNESIDHKNKSTYSSTNSKDSSGVLTGYIVTNSWDNDGHKGSSKTEYNTSWVVKTNTVTENGKITVYDASGEIISSSFDVTRLTGVADVATGLVVYNITDATDNSVTKFYMRGDALDHYNITHNSTNTSSGITIQSSDTTTFNAKGKTIERSGTTTSTVDATGIERDSSSYKIIDKFNASSVVTGHTTSSTWADTLGNSTKSTFEYNADWTNIVSSSNEYNSTYTGTDNLPHVNHTTDSKVTNLDGTITESNSWDNGIGSKGKSESVYSSALVLISKTVTDGVKITSYTYGADKAVTSTVISIDTTGLTGLFDAQSKLTAYSVTSNEGSITTYYVDGANKNVLVKYSVGASHSTTFDTITKINKSITTYDVKNNPLETDDTSISTYVVGTGVHTVETSSNKTLYKYDPSGTLLGVTITSTSENENGDSNSSVEEYDATWRLLSNTVNSNGIITVYDKNGLIVSSSDNVSTLGTSLGIDTDGFDVYSKTDNRGTVGDTNDDILTKYYVKNGSVEKYTTTTNNGSVINTTVFDANGKTIGNSSSGSNWSNSSSTVDNADGTHSSTNTWANGGKTGSSTTNYDVNWNVITSTIVENGKTTVYNDKWEVQSISIDVSVLGAGNPDVANGWTVYTLTDTGTETKYYIKTSTLGSTELVKYSNSYSGSNIWNDGTKYITSTYSGTTNFDALGKMIDSSGMNASTYVVSSVVHTKDSSSYNTSTQFAADGITVTGHTSSSTWSNESGNSGSSTNEYDANWQSISSESTNTSTSDGKTNTSTTKLVSDYDDTTPEAYIQTDTSNNDGYVVETVKKLDTNWKVLSSATTENGKTTTTAYDVNGNVISTKTQIGTLSDGVHSFTDDDGSVTTYYVSGGSVDYYTVTTTNINTWTDTLGDVTTTTDSISFFHKDGKAYGNGGASSSTYLVGTTPTFRDSSSYENIDNSDGSHTNKSTWSNETGNGSSTTQYTDAWGLVSKIITENGKTTTYGAVTGTSIDPSLAASNYEFTAPNGTVTKYYMSGTALDHYSTTSIGSSVADGITTTHQNTTNFYATGKVIDTINKTSWTDANAVAHERLSTTVDNVGGTHTVTSKNTDGTHVSTSIDEYTSDWSFAGRTFIENGKTTIYDSSSAVTSVSFDVSKLTASGSVIVNGVSLDVYSSAAALDGSITRCYYTTGATDVPQYYIESLSTSLDSWTYTDTTKYEGKDVVDNHTTGFSFGTYSSTATYNADWTLLLSTTVKDGAKTTTTNYKTDGTVDGTPTTIINTNGLTPDTTDGTIGGIAYTYTYTDSYSSSSTDATTGIVTVTKYYMSGAVLNAYSVSEYSTTDTDTQRSTTVFDANGNIIQTETGSGSTVDTTYTETWSNTTKTVDNVDGTHIITNDYNNNGNISGFVDNYDAAWNFVSRAITQNGEIISTIDNSGGSNIVDNDTSIVGSLTIDRSYTTDYNASGVEVGYTENLIYTDIGDDLTASTADDAKGTETRINIYNPATGNYISREWTIDWTYADNTTTHEHLVELYDYTSLSGGQFSITATNDHTDRDGYVFHSHWVETYNTDGTLANIETTTSGNYPVKSANSDPTLPFDASGTDIVFTITDTVGNYTFNIDGFDTGDSLVFKVGGVAITPTIDNTTPDDGIVNAIYTNGSNITTIHLTGTQDASSTDFLAAFA